MYHIELKPNRRTSLWNNPLSLDKELEKFFDVFTKEDSFAPACEIIDREKFYSVSLDMPGLTKEDIEIEVKDNHLYVSGERKAPKDQALRSERRYGKFSRIFSLPQNVNHEAIEANFENGVLDLTLPKEEKSQTKKINISSFKKVDAHAELKS